MIDTADIYGPTWHGTGHNERLVGKALRTYTGDTSSVVVATKDGIILGEGETWRRDGSYAHLRRAVEGSLRALGAEAIDLYQWHRPDRWKLHGDVISSFKTLQQEGKIRSIGISNANIEEIDVAVQVLGPADSRVCRTSFRRLFDRARARWNTVED